MEFPREEIRKLIKAEKLKTPEDAQEVLKQLFADTIEEMLKAELDANLGYERYEPKPEGTTNTRNGSSAKRLRTQYGEVEIAVPRDREGQFEPAVVKKHQTSTVGIEEQILALYAKGTSTRDIQAHLQQIYGLEVSPTLISHVTDKILPTLREWQSRPLQPVYAVVFLDAIHYKVRQDGHVENKAVYVVVGVDLSGQKDVLGMWIGEHESAKFWAGVLNELRNRGVQDILIAAVDNLRGFNEAIGAAFPRTEIQKCIVHQVRNSLSYVTYKDYKPIASALRPIYQAPSEEAGLAALDHFEEVWGKKYPLVVRSWRQNWPELATFFKFPPEVRRLIYTTNIIEGFHRQLRKVTKTKGAFPGDDALFKQLYLVAQDVILRWSRVQNWGLVLSQLTVFFEDRVSPYLS